MDMKGGIERMTKKEKQKYQVKEKACYDRECFIPFSGNGIKICRLYELGQCPKNLTGRSIRFSNPRRVS